MSLTVEALNIMLLLLPGFMSGQIFYSIYQTGEVTASKRTLDALVFSFLIYLITALFTKWEPLSKVEVADGNFDFIVNSDNKLILITILFIIVLPIIIGAIYHSDIFHCILRKCRVTTKTSRKNTWNDAFLTQDRYVIVTLKDKRRIRGYPTMFSTDPEEGFLYLFNPAWVCDEKESETDADYLEKYCRGFLLNRDNIELIEFTLDPGEILKVKRS
jgi:hypothetical protein